MVNTDIFGKIFEAYSKHKKWRATRYKYQKQSDLLKQMYIDYSTSPRSKKKVYAYVPSGTVSGTITEPRLSTTMTGKRCPVCGVYSGYFIYPEIDIHPDKKRWVTCELCKTIFDADGIVLCDTGNQITLNGL